MKNPDTGRVTSFALELPVEQFLLCEMFWGGGTFKQQEEERPPSSTLLIPPRPLSLFATLTMPCAGSWPEAQS